jgi:hypothetical protein
MALLAKKIAHDVESGDEACPPGGRQQGREHLDERALAGAVGTDEAENLARLDAQAGPIDGNKLAEPARQLVGDDGGPCLLVRHNPAPLPRRGRGVPAKHAPFQWLIQEAGPTVPIPRVPRNCVAARRPEGRRANRTGGTPSPMV